MPSKPPIYVTRPELPPLEALVPLLQEIWDCRILTNDGPQHQRLEAALCAHLGVEHLSLFNNATIALLTVMRALDITGEVITTPFSFVATAHAVLWAGATPVFADIDPATLNLDPRAVEAAITPATRAILPVHCYGRPCDTAAFEAIGRAHGIPVLYDAAHAFDVQHRGTSVLNFGDVSVLSFHATKVFNTFEGGAVVCRDAATKARVDRLRNFGIVDEDTVDMIGLNGKMSEFNAALGQLQLHGVREAIARRVTLDATYREHFAPVPGIRILGHAHEAGHNCAYFPILVDAQAYGETRDALNLRLRQRGIYARRYFHPLISSLPMYRHLPSAAPAGLPVAMDAASRVLCLPIYPSMTAGEQQAVIDGVLRRD